MKEAVDTLRFVTDDGRTIPRCGYRLEDFLDDDSGGEMESLDQKRITRWILHHDSAAQR